MSPAFPPPPPVGRIDYAAAPARAPVDESHATFLTVLLAILTFGLFGCAGTQPAADDEVRMETRECYVTVLDKVSQNTWVMLQTCGDATVVRFKPATQYPQPVPEPVEPPPAAPIRDSFREESHPGGAPPIQPYNTGALK